MTDVPSNSPYRLNKSPYYRSRSHREGLGSMQNSPHAETRVTLFVVRASGTCTATPGQEKEAESPREPSPRGGRRKARKSGRRSRPKAIIRRTYHDSEMGCHVPFLEDPDDAGPLASGRLELAAAYRARPGAPSTPICAFNQQLESVWRQRPGGFCRGCARTAFGLL